MSIKQQRQVGEVVRHMIDDNTPKEGNRCKALQCDGEVVEKVVGFFRNQYTYDAPSCDKCNRFYLYAKNVRRVGHKEFRELMLEPVII